MTNFINSHPGGKDKILLAAGKGVEPYWIVYRQHLNPYYNIVELDSKGNLKLVKRDKKKTYTRQKASIVYQLNGLVTINVERFLKYKRIYKPRCVPCEIQPETGLMIDTKFEFQIADCMAKNLIKF